MFFVPFLTKEISPSLFFLSNDNQVFIIVGIDEDNGINETYSTSIVGTKGDGSLLVNYSLICLGQI